MSDLKETTYYSTCPNCEAVVEGNGEYDETDGTLYGQNCQGCGEEFVVMGWFDNCLLCELYHQAGECEEVGE